jgi:hypothetical protein
VVKNIYLVNIYLVGYGDLSPQTSLGRMIIICATFIGITFISLITFFIGNYYALVPHEEKVKHNFLFIIYFKAYDLIRRTTKKEELNKLAAKVFKSTCKYHLTKNKIKKELQGQIPYRYRKDKLNKNKSNLEKNLLNILKDRIKNKRLFKKKLQ